MTHTSDTKISMFGKKWGMKLWIRTNTFNSLVDQAFWKVSFQRYTMCLTSLLQQQCLRITLYTSGENGQIDQTVLPKSSTSSKKNSYQMTSNLAFRLQFTFTSSGLDFSVQTSNSNDLLITKPDGKIKTFCYLGIFHFIPKKQHLLI